MNLFKSYFAYSKLKSLIDIATGTLYSEDFDFSKILKQLTVKSDKLTALIALQYSATANEPVNKNQIKEALIEIIKTKQDLANEGEMNIFLTSFSTLIEIEWEKRKAIILDGKLAYIENSNSYKGAIYYAEKCGLRPTTPKEKAEWKKVTDELIAAIENLRQIKEKGKSSFEELKQKKINSSSNQS